MILLLAQMVSPPIQPGPVRIPSRTAPESRVDSVELEIEDNQSEGNKIDNLEKNTQITPPTPIGNSPYTKEQTKKILQGCTNLENKDEATRCVNKLNAQLQKDGYINTRVVSESESGKTQIIIIPGKLVEINVSSKSKDLTSEIEKFLSPLLSRIFNIFEVKNALLSLERLGVASKISGSIGKLGSNPTKATLNITAERSPKPWEGETSIRNDGNAGSGEWRGVAVLQKKDLIKRGDQFLFYGELNADGDPELGAGIGSLSYGYPLTENLNITSSIGASRKYLVEFQKPVRDLSFRQYQGLIQADWVFQKSAKTSTYAFLGISANHNNSYYKNQSIPLILGGGLDGDLTSGFTRFGLGHQGVSNSLAWTGQLYGIQGINSFSSQDELSSLQKFGVKPGSARAIGAYTTGRWLINKKLMAKGIAGGQVALNPLTSSMGFSVGSDNGLRGLPGTLISGDNGWISNLELEWSVFEFKDNQIKVVPFGGAGGITTTRLGVTFDDTVGSYGVLLRWQHKNQISIDLGWANQFNHNNNKGLWNNWMIGNGIYMKASYRF